MTINGVSGGGGATGIEQAQGSTARSRFRAVHEAASDYLGVSADELRGKVANGQSLAQVAEASGKSVDGLTQAVAAAITKTAGSANATAIAERIVSASPPSGGPLSGGGFGKVLAQATRGAGGTLAPAGLAEIRTAVNDFLDLTDDEVRSQLGQGQTLGEIAEANGKSAGDLEQALSDAIAAADPAADAAAVAHRIVATRPSGPPAAGGIAGADTSIRLQGYRMSVGGGSTGGASAPEDRISLEQLLLDRLTTVKGGTFQGIDDFV
jgi:hypothetical protein